MRKAVDPLISKRVFIGLLFFQIALLSGFERADAKISVSEFVKEVKTRYQTEDLKRALETQVASQARQSSILKNPQVQYGRGILEYNAGQGLADYQEFSIAQSLVLNGVPQKQKQLAQLVGKKSQAHLQKAQLSLLAEALLLAAESTFVREQLSHVEHRQEHLDLISNYLKSRQFQSPRKQMESQLLRMKIDEIKLENKRVISRHSTLQNHLKFLLKSSEPVQMDFRFPRPNQVQALLKRLEPMKTIEDKLNQSELAVAELEKTIVDRQWVPDLQLYYNHSEEKFFGGNKNDVFGLGIEVPLFDMGRNRRAAATAHLTSLELKAKQSQISNQALKQKLIAEVRLALDALTVYSEATVKSREQAFLEASSHFKKGQIDAESFLNFEHEAHAVRSTRIQYQMELLQGLLGLVAQSGRENLLLEVFQ